MGLRWVDNTHDQSCLHQAQSQPLPIRSGCLHNNEDMSRRTCQSQKRLLEQCKPSRGLLNTDGATDGLAWAQPGNHSRRGRNIHPDQHTIRGGSAWASRNDWGLQSNFSPGRARTPGCQRMATSVLVMRGRCHWIWSRFRPAPLEVGDTLSIAVRAAVASTSSPPRGESDTLLSEEVFFIRRVASKASACSSRERVRARVVSWVSAADHPHVWIYLPASRATTGANTSMS
jgi:hypothetical protein